MIQFLIHRPVSVIMLFVGLLILAGIGIRSTDVALLPNLDIPVMIIQVDAANKSPAEVETQALAPLRRHLLTMNGIDDLAAEGHWGHGEIRIHFVYGWDMDKAFIETNEKVDLSLTDLPKEIARPRVIKTRAEDLPAYLLSLGYKDNRPGSGFLDLSEFAREVLRRRLEQLEEVALVDMHGAEKLQIEIIPDDDKLAAIGLDQEIIHQEINQQHIPVSSILIKERNYRYLVQIGHPLHSISRLKEVKLVVGDRVLQLADVAEIRYASQAANGAFIDRGVKAISLAIIKTPRSSLYDLEKNLNRIMTEVQTEFPGLELSISRDQTQLLEVTIDNLYNSLILGCILAVTIVFFFYNYWRIPVLMAIVIPVSLLITLLFFKAFSISINMLSLSGILLGLGLMIDNGIIVLDNISQAWNRETDLADACIHGTNEMIRPLLTSMLTTCSVFIPLMFLSGLAGALFWDQAMAVSISLIISYLVSIILLPTLYFALIKRKNYTRVRQKNRMILFLESWYHRGLQFFLDKKTYAVLLIFLFCLGLYPILNRIVVERFPALPEYAVEISIDWNEPIRPDVAIQRLQSIFENTGEPWQAHVGEGQYLQNNFYDGKMTSAAVLLKYTSQTNPELLKQNIRHRINTGYPRAIVNIAPEKTAFHMMFPESNGKSEIRCYLPQHQNNTNSPLFKEYHSRLQAGAGDQVYLEVPSSDKSYLLELNHEKMLHYQVDQRTLLAELKKLLGHHEIAKISSFQYQLPVIVKSEPEDITSVLLNHFIKNKENEQIPIRQLVSLQSDYEPRSVFASNEGAYIPMWVSSGDDATIEKITKEIASSFPEIKVDLLSPSQQNNRMIRDILLALLASILLLYFLMAAQFESLILPLVVLAEIPISLTGSIYFLWLFGSSVNVMSAIGMVVTIGIIINDSIIKIDTIHRMKRTGTSTREAIYAGGLKRLNPIIMTSLTTILALLPFLWGDDLGRMLQRPLALSLIGGLGVGTLVSLFVIPMLYELTARKY